MKKMKMFAATAAMIVGLSSAALAGEVNVVLHSDAWGVGQIALSGAFAPVKATADAVNIAAYNDLEANGVDMAFVHADAFFVAQGAVSVAVAKGCGGCGKGGIAKANATNLAAVNFVDVKTYKKKAPAYVHVGSSAIAVLQVAGSLAIAGKNATSAATNIAAFNSVQVNVN